MLQQRDGYRFSDWKCIKVSGQPFMSSDRGTEYLKSQKNHLCVHTSCSRRKGGPWSERIKPVLILLPSAPPSSSLVIFFLNPHHVCEHRVTQRKHRCRSQRESLVNKPVSKTPARASSSHSLPRRVGGLFSDIKRPRQLKTKARCGFTELRQKS